MKLCSLTLRVAKVPVAAGAVMWLLLIHGELGAQSSPAKGPANEYAIPEKPWIEVLAWLKDQTGLPVMTANVPTGTFRLPGGHKPPMTMAEVFDVLNEALGKQNFMLVRRQASIAIWPLDWAERQDFGRRLFTLEDLPSLKKTDCGRIPLQLTKLKADELAPAVLKMLSVWGRVIPLEEPNQLILVDFVGNLRKAVRQLQEMDAIKGRVAIPRDSWKNTLEWLSARTQLPFVGRVIPTKPFRGPLPASVAIWDTGEIIDLLNQELADQQLLIIRGDRAINVVFTDEAIDPSLVARVRWEELEERGKSEVVSVAVTVNGLKAAEVMPSVKKMLSRVGKVWEEPSNQLVVQDKTEKVIEALNMLRRLGEKQGGR